MRRFGRKRLWWIVFEAVKQFGLVEFCRLGFAAHELGRVWHFNFHDFGCSSDGVVRWSLVIALVFVTVDNALSWFGRWCPSVALVLELLVYRSTAGCTPEIRLCCICCYRY